MVALQTPPVVLQRTAPHFILPATDGQSYTPHDVLKEKGLIVMFICNHCPFVQAILPELVEDVKKMQQMGIGAIAIMSNDTTQYPEDSFENMQALATTYQFSFPYCLDESQSIAKAYGAVCTPDFFGFDEHLQEQYRGRFDNAGMNRTQASEHDLLNAMTELVNDGQISSPQHPSIGCSIKWT